MWICAQKNDVIPTLKVLEAITKNCQETFQTEPLEILGDSFQRYARSQQLFKTYQKRKRHEALLSLKRQKITGNTSLCKLGCDGHILGFIHNEPFHPKLWIELGGYSGTYQQEKEVLSAKRNKRVADVVEALIGACLSTGGETSALFFMKWLGIGVDFSCIPYSMPLPLNPEKLVNVKFLEALLNYKFRDGSLLVEALTHVLYMLPQIPRCYQCLEFLGDAVLDYLIATHLYFRHLEISRGLLTNLRSSTSVNNGCYSQSTIRAGCHEHILHASQVLHSHIVIAATNFQQSGMVSTFMWEL